MKNLDLLKVCFYVLLLFLIVVIFLMLNLFLMKVLFEFINVYFDIFVVIRKFVLFFCSIIRFYFDESLIVKNVYKLLNWMNIYGNIVN